MREGKIFVIGMMFITVLCFSTIYFYSYLKNEKNSISENLDFPSLFDSYSSIEFYYPDDNQINMYLSLKDKSIHGEALHYYEDGRLKSKFNYNEGELYGNNFIFHKNGHMKSYFYFGRKGEVNYGRFYDSNGEVISEGGHPITNLTMIDKTHNVPDTFKLKFKLAPIPNTKRTLFLSFDKTGEESLWQVKDIKYDFNFHYEEITEPGEYLMRLKYIVQDTNADHYNEYLREIKVKAY